MAPASRKSTGTSRPRTAGAAPAVSPDTVEAQEVVTVEGEAQPHTADDAPATDVPTPEVAPATDLDGTTTEAQTAAADAAATPPRDLAVLATLADTSGRAATTPYPGAPAPAPVRRLPPLRDTHAWAAENDPTATARVLIDGWRTRVNGVPRFAGKGDRVTAPVDVIEAGIARGTLAPEPQK